MRITTAFSVLKFLIPSFASCALVSCTAPPMDADTAFKTSDQFVERLFFDFDPESAIELVSMRFGGSRLNRLAVAKDLERSVGTAIGAPDRAEIITAQQFPGTKSIEAVYRLEGKGGEVCVAIEIGRIGRQVTIGSARTVSCQCSACSLDLVPEGLQRPLKKDDGT